MVKTRKPLGCLASDMNVGGADTLRRRAGPERTPVERHTRAMYARREELWRGLSRQRVAAFLRMFMLCLVERENSLFLERDTYKMLKKTLVKRIVPWICKWLVFSMEERYWPITLVDFRGLDQYLEEHMPRVHKEDEWGTVSYFFKEMLKQREEYARMEQMEREAMEAVRRCLSS